MKFLSTSTFRPLALWGLLLVTVTAAPTSQVLKDFRADTTSSKPTTSNSQAFRLFTLVLHDVQELKSETCKHNVNCLEEEKAMLNNLNLPKIKIEDGCFYGGYNWETCHLKIITGLLKFQIYLQYMQNKLQSDSENEKAEKIYTSVKSLSLFMKAKVSNTEQTVFPSPTANATLLEELESQNETQKLLIVQIVLCSLEEFLQNSLRPIRKAGSDLDLDI
ncbi:Interleukin-6 [Heterocephalus glaber]|uniref:Interleukin-6 n=1 Tax=Heterocephalus glaber TaxID=10181 RepID=G5BB49_HETGA|nr:interleukin-6 [Heterocephalus glaber]EHB06510.1 Interleukin-6 [Heterocephalus glaber]